VLRVWILIGKCYRVEGTLAVSEARRRHHRRSNQKLEVSFQHLQPSCWDHIPVLVKYLFASTPCWHVRVHSWRICHIFLDPELGVFEILLKVCLVTVDL
jgi:hypothetical protein